MKTEPCRAKVLSPRFLRILCVAAASLFLAACDGGQGLFREAGERVVHGNFEIVATGRKISTGAFPNTSGNPFERQEVTSFSVLHAGRPVVVPEVGKAFWQVLRVAGAPQPALLVSTTDFHLITERDGEPVVTALTERRTDVSELQWLDSVQRQPGERRLFGIRKVSATEGTVLSGGRWLLVSRRAVLDVETLKIYPVRPWVPSDSGSAFAGLNGSVVTARAFSPGQTQYVLPASDRDREQGTDRYDALLVVDIPTGDAYGVRLDPRRMRFADHDDIDAGWVAHHFQWRREGDGRERLVQRERFEPWPWRGRIVAFGAEMLEYRVYRVTPAMEQELHRVVRERLGAQPARGAEPARGQSEPLLSVPGCPGWISIGAHADHVTAYVRGPAGNLESKCPDTVRRIGAEFDAELRTGRLDHLLTFGRP